MSQLDDDDNKAALPVDSVEAAASDDADGDETMLVATYATHSQGYFDCLKESCERYGYSLTVLGFGEKWRGYAVRLRAMRDFLAAQPPQQLVLFVDAFDVIMCGPMREAVQTYRRIIGNRKMLAGASRCVGPPIFTKRLMGDEGCDDECKGSSPYIYICAGTYIVRAADGIALIDRMAPFDDSDDDQKLLVRLRKKTGFGTIGIDCNFDLFATLMPYFGGVDIRRSDRIDVFTDKRTGLPRVRCGATGTTPILIHGPAHTDLRPLLPRLKLSSLGEQPPKKYVMGKVWYHTRATARGCVDLFTVAAVFLLAFVAIVTLAVLYARERMLRRRIERNPTPTTTADNIESTGETIPATATLENAGVETLPAAAAATE